MKGAETKWFLGYVVKALREKGNRLVCQHALVEAGQHLLAYKEIISTAPRRLTPGKVVDMFSHMKGLRCIGRARWRPSHPKVPPVGSHVRQDVLICLVCFHIFVQSPLIKLIVS